MTIYELIYSSKPRGDGRAIVGSVRIHSRISSQLEEAVSKCEYGVNTLVNQ